MGFFHKEDLFRKKEKINPEDMPKFSFKDRLAMILAALWIVLPLALAVMAGLVLLVLFIRYIYGA